METAEAMERVVCARESWRSDLFPGLASLREETCCTDTRLISGTGGISHAHSLVLGAVSPVLRRMLTPSTADAEGCYTLHLPQAHGIELEAMVRAVYAGSLAAHDTELLERHGLLVDRQPADTKPCVSNLAKVKINVKEEAPEEIHEMENEKYFDDYAEDVNLGYEDPGDLDFDCDDKDDVDFEVGGAHRLNGTKAKKAKKKVPKGNKQKGAWNEKVFGSFDFFKHKDLLSTKDILDVALTCTFCDKQCTNAVGFRRHQQACKENHLSQAQCHACPFLAESLIDLSKHMEDEHPDPESQRKKDGLEQTHCKFCNIDFMFLGNFPKVAAGSRRGKPILPFVHQRSCLKSIMKNLKCGQCPVQTPNKEMLLEHMKTCHSAVPPPYPCLKPDCDRISSSKKLRIKHMVETHGIRPEKDGRSLKATFSCSFCVVANHFKSEDELKKHEEHWHRVPCSEEGCDYTCESEQQLQEHGIKKHGFKVPESLKLPTPPSKQSVCCDQCGKRFANTHNLKDHMELHEDKEVMCDKCDKVFKRVLNLRMHIKAVHSDKTYVCHFCTQECKNTRTLRGHIQQYHEEKKFHCDLCNKGFLSQYKLKEHTVSVHSKTTPFSCKYGCGRAYNDRSNCRQHERSVHEGNPRGPKAERSNGFSLVQASYSP